MAPVNVSSRGPWLALGLVAASVTLSAAACGGGDDGATPVDAKLDAAIDAGIDAPTCGASTCGGAQADTCVDETHCGNCATACDPGQACQAGDCACPPPFVPAMPSFIQQQINTTTLPGATLGLGGMLDATIDALVVGYPTATVQTNHAYDLSMGTPGTPPFAAVGYDLDLQTLTPSASFYATAGTLTFTRICAAGFEGTLTGAHFVAVAGLMNPTLVPNGCAFDVPTITFAYGDVCPPPS